MSFVFPEGNKYYRYSNGPIARTANGYIELPGTVDADFPRDLSIWKGLPNSIDAAFVGTDRYSYFFKNEFFYRFNDRDVRVSFTSVHNPACFPQLRSPFISMCPVTLKPL